MKRNYHVVELDSKGADKTIEMFARPTDNCCFRW
jgi:hypothetical protein